MENLGGGGEFVDELTLHLEGKVNGQPITPANAPLDTVALTLEALRKFISATSSAPGQATISFSEGSLKLGSHVPPDTAVHLSAVVQQDAYDQGDPYYTMLGSISAALKRHDELHVDVVLGKEELLRLTGEGVPVMVKELDWLETSTTVYGYLYDLGGVNPNIHVQTEDYGTLTIRATKDEIRDLRVYTHYNFSIDCLMLRSDYSHLRECRLRHAIKANGDTSLEEAMNQEGPKWRDVDDIVEWVRDLRGEA